MITIENEQLKVTISTLGAEVHLLVDKTTGKEYLWQGDRRYWKGRSPVLFPITGGLWNGKTQIGNQSYAIPKHGFVNKERWEVKDNKKDSVTLSYRSSDRFAQIFPYEYELEVTFEIKDRELFVHFNVINLSEEPIYFQMGGHPGFTLPGFDAENQVDGYLTFEGNSDTVLRAGAQGCIEIDESKADKSDSAGNVIPTLDAVKRFSIEKTEDGYLPISVKTFENEALIFAEQISAVTLHTLDKKPYVTVRSTSPVWLFWSPQGVHSPFLCCEPWYGLPDLQGFNGPIEERAYIQKAEPKSEWKGGYSIFIHEQK